MEADHSPGEVISSSAINSPHPSFYLSDFSWAKRAAMFIKKENNPEVDFEQSLPNSTQKLGDDASQSPLIPHMSGLHLKQTSALQVTTNSSCQDSQNSCKELSNNETNSQASEILISVSDLLKNIHVPGTGLHKPNTTASQLQKTSSPDVLFLWLPQPASVEIGANKDCSKQFEKLTTEATHADHSLPAVISPKYIPSGSPDMDNSRSVTPSVPLKNPKQCEEFQYLGGYKAKLSACLQGSTKTEDGGQNDTQVTQQNSRNEFNVQVVSNLALTAPTSTTEYEKRGSLETDLNKANAVKHRNPKNCVKVNVEEQVKDILQAESLLYEVKKNLGIKDPNRGAACKLLQEVHEILHRVHVSQSLETKNFEKRVRMSSMCKSSRFTLLHDGKLLRTRRRKLVALSQTCQDLYEQVFGVLTRPRSVCEAEVAGQSLLQMTEQQGNSCHLQKEYFDKAISGRNVWDDVTGKLGTLEFQCQRTESRSVESDMSTDENFTSFGKGLKRLNSLYSTPEAFAKVLRMAGSEQNCGQVTSDDIICLSSGSDFSPSVNNTTINCQKQGTVRASKAAPGSAQLHKILTLKPKLSQVAKPTFTVTNSMCGPNYDFSRELELASSLESAGIPQFDVNVSPSSSAASAGTDKRKTVVLQKFQQEVLPGCFVLPQNLMKVASPITSCVVTSTPNLTSCNRHCIATSKSIQDTRQTTVTSTAGPTSWNQCCNAPNVLLQDTQEKTETSTASPPSWNQRHIAPGISIQDTPQTTVTSTAGPASWNPCCIAPSTSIQDTQQQIVSDLTDTNLSDTGVFSMAENCNGDVDQREELLQSVSQEQNRNSPTRISIRRLLSEKYILPGIKVLSINSKHFASITPSGCISLGTGATFKSLRLWYLNSIGRSKAPKATMLHEIEYKGIPLEDILNGATADRKRFLQNKSGSTDAVNADQTDSAKSLKEATQLEDKDDSLITKFPQIAFIHLHTKAELEPINEEVWSESFTVPVDWIESIDKWN